jgi:hypothetical protein
MRHWHIKKLCDKKIKGFGCGAALTLAGIMAIQEGMKVLATYLRT